MPMNSQLPTVPDVNRRDFIRGGSIATLMTMLGGVVLDSALDLVGGWSELLGKGVTVTSFLIAVRLSFLVCRRLWPVGLEISESS